MQCLKCELAVYCSCSCILCEWLIQWLIEWVSEPGSLPLPQYTPVTQLLTLHLSQSFTSGSCSCRQSLVLPRWIVQIFLMDMVTWNDFHGPNFRHGIFDPWACTGTLWVGDKVLLITSLNSSHICDIQAPEFPLDCCRGAVWVCKVILVQSRNRISWLWWGREILFWLSRMISFNQGV